MGRPKQKKVEETIEKVVEKPTIEPYYVRVMDGDSIKVIDANKEPNWQLKYKHASGSNFHY